MRSASAVYGDLLRNLIVSCLAAFGLVGATILLFVRFPHYMNGKRLEQQTELARQVQMDLLPPFELSVRGVDFAAVCLPAWQVGGDFYDVFCAGDGRVAVALGDVSGKGLPASVVVGLLLGAVRASNWMGGSREHEASTARLNELLRTRAAVERFASLFWCYYDPAAHLLCYVNAGHPPPMLFRGGKGEPQIDRLKEGGPVLGVVPDAQYRQGEVPVQPGDLLVIYSDGVVEAANGEGELFEEDRLLAVIRQNIRRPSGEIRDAILARLKDFLGTEQAPDDITLVVARFLDTEERSA